MASNLISADADTDTHRWLPSHNPSQYRLLLQSVAQQLVKKDLVIAKFLCSDLVPSSKLEKAKILDLLKELEDGGYLSCSDCRLLSELLYHMGRRDILKKQMRLDPKQVEAGLRSDTYRSHLSKYRILLHKLASEISSKSLDNMKYLYSDQLSVSDFEKVGDIWSFFTLMETAEIISEDNLEELQNLLESIGQRGLLALISDYNMFENKGHQSDADEKARCGSSHLYYPRTENPTDQSLPDQYRAQHPVQETNPSPGVYVPPEVTYNYRLEQKLRGNNNNITIDDNMPRDVRVSSTIVPVTLPENVAEELPEYKMTSNPRGCCYIFNNQTFSHIPNDPHSKKLGSRPGSKADADGIKQTFEWLGFHCQQYENKSVEVMTSILHRISKIPHADKDCVVVCILSHGGNGYVYGCQGKKLFLRDILHHFRPEYCPDLAGKPKIFFIAACQGNDKRKAPEIQTDGPEIQNDGPEAPNCIASDSDFLIGFATVPGQVSYRHEDHGTWYIQTLIEQLKNHAHRHHLMDILTEVNREVVRKCAPGDDGKVYKQMPLPYTTLTQRVFLRPVNM